MRQRRRSVNHPRQLRHTRCRHRPPAHHHANHPPRPQRPRRHPHLPGHHDLRRAGRRSRRARHPRPRARARRQLHRHRRDVPGAAARARPTAPPRRIIGHWFAARPGVRQRVVLATKVAGPSRGMDWVRGGSADLTPADIAQACDDSLRRLQTDVIDLYQIHWPNRNVPIVRRASTSTRPRTRDFSLDPRAARSAGQRWCKAGKVRAHRPVQRDALGRVRVRARWPSSTACRASPRVQNPYCLINRAVDNGLDEVMHRSGVSLLAYSPLGLRPADRQVRRARLRRPDASRGRMALFERMRKQRWGRARGAGRGAALQRAGARARPDADAHGAGLLLHATGAWPARSSA